MFIKWVLYGLWHSFAILFLVFYVLVQTSAVQNDGKEIGFWIAGMTVYGVCEFIANGVLFMKYNVHNYEGIILIILMVAAYFVFYAIFSLIPGNIYHSFNTNMSIILVWLSFLIALG